jgi:hypothetical protein
MTYVVGQILLMGTDKSSLRPYIVTEVLSHIENDTTEETTYSVVPQGFR